MSESMRASVRLIILWVCVCVCVYVNTCVNIYICVNLCSSTLFVLIVYKHTDHVLADLHQEFVLRYKEVVSCCERKHSESRETDCFFMIVAKSINVTTESTHRSVNGCSMNERRHLKSWKKTPTGGCSCTKTNLGDKLQLALFICSDTLAGRTSNQTKMV